MRVYIITKAVGIKKIITYPDTMSVFTASGDTEFVEKKDILPCIQMLLSENRVSMELAQEIAKDYPDEFKDKILKVNDATNDITFSLLNDASIARTTRYQKDLNEAIMNSLETESLEDMNTIRQEQIKLASQQPKQLTEVARAMRIEDANSTFNTAGVQNSLNQHLLSKQSLLAYNETSKVIKSHVISDFNCEFENVTKRNSSRNVLLTVTSELTEKEQLYITNAEKQAILKCHDEVKFAGILKDIPNGTVLANMVELAVSVNDTPKLN